jgi:hypothetical protein
MTLHVCVRGIGIRRSKDLRAEIGKCPVSTNERKNMSTKTLRKRIALVAVAALGAGVLSVAPASAAGTDGAIVDLTGSIGLLASDSVTGVAGTATLLSTGTLSVTVDAADVIGTDARLEVTGGAVQSNNGGTVAADQLSATEDTTVDETNFAVTIKPTVAAGQKMTVKTFATATGTTVVSQLVVTIAASSVAGVVSPADSTLAWVSTDGEAQAADEAGESSATYGNALFLSIQLNDAYAADITSTSGALVVSVSSGATVKLASTAGNAVGGAGTFNTAVSALNPADINAYIAESTVGAGWNGTVTVTYNGVTVGTKSGKITGAPASITVTPKKIGTTAGGANEDSFTFLVKDTAGNLLDFTATNYVLNKSSDLTIVSDAAGTEDGTAATATPANGDHTCAGTAGSADVSLKTTINGTVLVSNTVKLTCGGTAVAYSASFDKASYIQGEIATLTATFKDAAGNLAHSYSTVTTADGDTTISAPMMVRVGGDTILAATKPGLSGTIAHTFTVGTNSGLTEGSYNAVVNYSKTLTLASPVTVAYKVGTGSTGVTNADVLKAIVSLIASINKQIAALQKALLKK